MTHAIVLAPQVGGHDGVSELARQVIEALQTEVHRSIASVEVWSLADETRPAAVGEDIRFRTARSSRTAFAALAAGAALRPRALLMIAVHSHLLPATLPAACRGARVVPILLGIEAWKPFTRLQRVAFRRAGRALAISRHTVAKFRDANPALAGVPIDVCHPGVPDERVQPGVSPRRPFALIVGRMAADERYKGHDELLEAWAQVLDAVPQAQLVVAGTGDDEARLRAKAERLGLRGPVTFEGRVSDARLRDLYREASCFVMPSRREGFGLVYLEAMAAGAPCIAAPGPAEEIIQHGVSGLIVDPDDRAAIAAAVVRMFQDPAARDRMGAAALARVRERFAASVFRQRFLSMLELDGEPVGAAGVSEPVC